MGYSLFRLHLPFKWIMGSDHLGRWTSISSCQHTSRKPQVQCCGVNNGCSDGSRQRGNQRSSNWKMSCSAMHAGGGFDDVRYLNAGTTTFCSRGVRSLFLAIRSTPAADQRAVLHQPSDGARIQSPSARHECHSGTGALTVQQQRPPVQAAELSIDH